MMRCQFKHEEKLWIFSFTVGNTVNVIFNISANAFSQPIHSQHLTYRCNTLLISYLMTFTEVSPMQGQQQLFVFCVNI